MRMYKLINQKINGIVKEIDWKINEIVKVDNQINASVHKENKIKAIVTEIHQKINAGMRDVFIFSAGFVFHLITVKFLLPSSH